MSDLKTVELKATVLDSTEKALQKTAEAVGMYVGEVIDRIALNWQAQDPIYAAQLILEDVIINTNHLKDPEINEALMIVLSVIEKCMDDLSAENIRKAAAEYFETFKK